MALCNTNLVGKAFAPYQKTLTAKEALAYAAATDDDNPHYHGPHALAPPLSVVTLSLVHGAAPILCDPDLFADPMLLFRLVHLEEDILWHRPVYQGMDLSSQGKLAAIEERSNGDILRIEVQIHEAGAPLATVRTAMFVRGPSRGARGGAVRPAHSTVEPTCESHWTVAADQSERYAEASGDRNPIHLDDDVARASGLKSRILHGLCTMAFAQRAAIAQHAAHDPKRLERLRVAFARPVYMGDTLTWAAAQSTNNSNSVDFFIANQAGRSVCTDGLAVIGSAF